MPTFNSSDLSGLRSALRGQYVIERELGRGGMGIVFLARDERLDRPVALKVLPPELARQVETRERFLREARTAAQLSHPNIVPIHRADEIDGLAFFTMGFIDGDTFADRIRDRAPLTATETVRVMREVAWALAYAHARGIVHRDIKPENILLDRVSGRAIVTDFGIARTTFDPSITADGYVLGTVHYMSPEQCAGDTLDGRSDLYALGVAGYHALSGRLPFDGDSPQAIIVAHATRDPLPLRSIAPDVPAPLAEVIDCCLQKNPANRYATGEALADALTKALEASAPAAGTGTDGAVLSTDQALAVWRRAAQLQAEAATRLEVRVRDGALAGETRSLPVGAEGNGDTRSAAEADAVVRTDGYRAYDVEAAAVEAGISQQYVALALAELERAPEALQRADDLPVWKRQLSTRLLGTDERTLSVTRTFRVPPRETLAAIGRTLQAHPYGLTLRDTLGGHPLDGGVLVFTLPAMVDATYKWTYTRYAVYSPELRVSMRAAPGDARACDVTMQVDLAPGLTAVLAGYTFGCAGMAAGGAGIGLAVGAKALALSGALLAMPALAGWAVVGMGSALAVAPLHRWAIRKVRKELEDTLAAIETSVRAQDIFGIAPPTGVPARQGDDAFLMFGGGG